MSAKAVQALLNLGQMLTRLQDADSDESRMTALQILRPVLDSCLSEALALPISAPTRSAAKMLQACVNLGPQEPGLHSALLAGTVLNASRSLYSALAADLEGQAFLFVPASKRDYYDPDGPYLASISVIVAEFPDSERDLVEAGRCFALGRDTACVFHLICAAEHALGRLAQKCDVPPTKPLEECEWGDLLKALDGEWRRWETGVPGVPAAERNKQRAFWSSVRIELGAWKHEWRNAVMHALKRPHHFSEEDARRALECVPRSIVVIATRMP